MRFDIVVCIISITLGMVLGILMGVRVGNSIDCIIFRAVYGNYSPFGTLIKVIIYSAFALSFIVFTAFIKLHKIIHYFLLGYLGYRLGMDIMIISKGVYGVLSIIIIYIPYYLTSLFIYISLILYVRKAIPNPRPNWWCYSIFLRNECLKRAISLMIPLTVIYLTLFFINPLLIQVIIVVI